MSKEYFDIWTKRFPAYTPAYKDHPREDYHLVSGKYPIFVIADGVTLKRDEHGNYPVPSGAGELAKLFCEKVIEEAEKIYDSFSEESLKLVFQAGNKVTKELNDKHDLVEGKLNYRDVDYFSATTSFALLKDGKMYWWSMHDCGVKAVNSVGMLVFNSPKVIPNKEKFFVGKQDTMTETELLKAIRRNYRNKIDTEGNLSGYGVVTGEEIAPMYLSTGMFDLKDVATVLVYTDGFENYVEDEKFLKLVAEWSENFAVDISDFSASKSAEDPKMFGQERSLIVIKIDK